MQQQGEQPAQQAPIDVAPALVHLYTNDSYRERYFKTAHIRSLKVHIWIVHFLIEFKLLILFFY